ncbi:hypothetical protein [Oceanobacillus oncorhynchi]|nr:hypothetical protein [Oceanobacillus oncorhynchi]UUI38488.1 hypothetical protein NP440_14200 [Oceanobacillus oncorhynchi]
MFIERLSSLITLLADVVVIRPFAGNRVALMQLRKSEINCQKGGA